MGVWEGCPLSIRLEGLGERRELPSGVQVEPRRKTNIKVFPVWRPSSWILLGVDRELLLLPGVVPGPAEVLPGSARTPRSCRDEPQVLLRSDAGRPVQTATASSSITSTCAGTEDCVRGKTYKSHSRVSEASSPVSIQTQRTQRT